MMDFMELMKMLGLGGGAGMSMPGGAGLGIQGAPMDMSTGAVNPDIGVQGAGMPPPAPPQPPQFPLATPPQPDYGSGPGQITPPTVPGSTQPSNNPIDRLTSLIRSGTDRLRGGGGLPQPTPPPTSLGEALEPRPLPSELVPQPAPGTPMPMARPAGLGAPAGGGGGVPTPQPRPAGAPQTPAGGFGDIAKILQGVRAQGPDVVKPSTPGIHQPRAIGPSDLMALLASLGMGGHRSQRTPTTLGQALELKPSAWGGIYG